MKCLDCERYKLSASMWRNEAYKHAGTPLPWEPEELLRKEYERGYADAMNWKVQNHLEHLPPKREWVGLTDEPVAYDKTELNGFVQDLYDKKMQEGKHGHYETMFHCVHQAIKKIYTRPQEYERGYADAMNWKVQNHLEHLPPKEKNT